MDDYLGYDVLDVPKKAKRVFKGVLFDVYQWEQEMFDGSKRTFEKIWRKPTVQIITITINKKIVLLNEKQPNCEKFISLPGGQVERDERIIDCVNKELLEETGMKSPDILFLRKVILSRKIDWKSYYFIAQNCSKVEEQNLGNGEDIDIFEVDFEEFIKQTQREDFRNKYFQNYIFKMIHTKGEIKKFKKKLFD